MTTPAKIIVFFVFIGIAAGIGGTLGCLLFVVAAAAQAWVVEEA